MSSQALVEVQRSLPVPQRRFDEFLQKAHALADAAAAKRNEAAAYSVDSETAFQLADARQAGLKGEVKEIGEARLSLTRAIDDFKNVFVDAEKSATDLLNEAVKTYQMKMLTYRREVQRAAEAEAEEARKKNLERARKLEERAAHLKTESAKDKLYQQADSIKQAAELITATAPEPVTIASDLRDNWKSEPKPGRLRDALLWLADHPEWFDMIQFTPAGSKRLAKQFHNVPEKAEPFRIWNDQGFATKRR